MAGYRQLRKTKYVPLKRFTRQPSKVRTKRIENVVFISYDYVSGTATVRVKVPRGEDSPEVIMEKTFKNVDFVTLDNRHNTAFINFDQKLGGCKVEFAKPTTIELVKTEKEFYIRD